MWTSVDRAFQKCLAWKAEIFINVMKGEAEVEHGNIYIYRV